LERTGKKIVEDLNVDADSSSLN